MTSIRLILDASALLLFGRGALPVGETIAEVTDEGDLYATPVTVYVDVLRRLDGSEPELAEMARLVRMLMAAPAARILPVLQGDADALLYWSKLVGGVEHAACVVAMLARPGSYLLSATPELYEGELGEGSVIRIED